jgi:hypothetical protein
MHASYYKVLVDEKTNNGYEKVVVLNLGFHLMGEM